MKTTLALLCLIASVFSSDAQSKFAGEYIGIGTPVKWSALERSIVYVFILTNGEVDVDIFNYRFDYFPNDSAIGQLDLKGGFSAVSPRGMLFKGKVSAAGGTVKGTAHDFDSRYTFTCLRRFRAAYDPLR